MQSGVLQGILIPFPGTTSGSACVLFMKEKPEFHASEGTDRICAGRQREQ